METFLCEFGPYIPGITTSGTGKKDGGCSLHSGRGTQVLTTQADPKEASPELVEPDFQMFTGYRHS